MQSMPRPGAGRSVLARIRDYDWATYRQRFTPKLITILNRGYSPDDFRHDAAAGLTVAILALPLSMASGSSWLPCSSCTAWRRRRG